MMCTECRSASSCHPSDVLVFIRPANVNTVERLKISLSYVTTLPTTHSIYFNTLCLCAVTKTWILRRARKNAQNTRKKFIFFLNMQSNVG